MLSQSKLRITRKFVDQVTPKQGGANTDRGVPRESARFTIPTIYGSSQRFSDMNSTTSSIENFKRNINLSTDLGSTQRLGRNGFGLRSRSVIPAMLELDQSV